MQTSIVSQLLSIFKKLFVVVEEL